MVEGVASVAGGDVVAPEILVLQVVDNFNISGSEFKDGGHDVDKRRAFIASDVDIFLYPPVRGRASARRPRSGP